MKKIILYSGILFTMIFLLSSCAIAPGSNQSVAATAYNEEEQQAIDELYANAEELLQALDTKDLEEYLKTLSEYEGTDFKERIMQMISGDLRLDYSSLWQATLSFIWEEGQSMLPAFAVICAVALLCGILNSAKNSFLQSTMTDIIGFVSYISVGAVVLSVLVGILDAGFSAVNNMRRQMEIVYPLLLTLMAAGGGSVSAGIFRPAVAFMSGTVCELFVSLVMPVAVAVIVLAFVGNLSSDVRTERLGEFFKSVSKWLIGLTLGLFTVFLTVQGISAAQYDGISLRAVKYLISGSVPIVGGFLSGGVDLVLAGSVLIKNALGSFSVFMLFAALLRPVLFLAAFQLFLRFSAAVTEPAGGKIPAFLSRLAADSSFFLAGVLCVAFLYFLTIVLLVCSTGVIF